MVLLVTPNTKKINYGLTSSEFSAVQPNIYMHLLESAYNSRGIDTTSIHMEADGVDLDTLIGEIRLMNPMEVGIISSGSNPSASTMTMVGTIEICKRIKQELPNQKVFVWGGHPTVMPERTKLETGADRVIIGTDFGMEPAFIPTINWKKIDPKKYKAHNWHCFGNLSDRTPYAAIWTTLGCPYQCEFCCINNVFEKRVYKMRHISDVLDEIDILVNLGVKNIKIMDELFVSNNHKRLIEFCDGIKERKYKLNMWAFARTDTVNPSILNILKEAGINWLAYGFESIHQSMVTDQHKGSKVKDYEKVIKWTKDAGISIIADFIAGFLNDTPKTLKETYDFMCSQNFEFINLYPLFAYPGTPLYDKYIANGIIPKPTNWAEYSLYGVDCKPCPTKEMSSKDVLQWRDEHYVKYYKRTEYLNMIKNKYGDNTCDHIIKMSNMKLDRNICQ